MVHLDLSFVPISPKIQKLKTLSFTNIMIATVHMRIQHWLDLSTTSLLVVPHKSSKIYLEFTYFLYFSDFIKPICLPLSLELRRRTYVNSTVVISGWGQTEKGWASKVKLKIAVCKMISIFHTSVSINLSVRYQQFPTETALVYTEDTIYPY